MCLNLKFLIFLLYCKIVNFHNLKDFFVVVFASFLFVVFFIVVGFG